MPAASSRRGNYKTAGGLHGVGASVVNALSKELVATVRRDGTQWEQRFQQGKPHGPLKKLGAGARHRHDGVLPPRSGDLPEDRVRRRADPRAARDRELPASRPQDHLRRRGHRRSATTFVARGRPRRLPGAARRPSAARGPCTTPASSLARDDRTSASSSRCSGPSRPTSTSRSYVNGIPTGSGGTHENGLRAGIGKAIRNFIETHNLSPKGVTLTAEDIREGLVGDPQRVRPGAAVPGPDQGPAEQSRDAGRGRRRGASGARALAESQHLDRRSRSSRGSSSRRARAKPAARRSRKWSRKTRDLGAGSRSPASSATARSTATAAHRDLHRRGRFGRRLGQAGPRPHAPGDPAAARQGAERRERVDGQGAREQGALGPRHRARLRHRQELRPGAAALRQGHHPGRRRFRRPSHRDAAPDVHLPPHAAADPARPRLPGAAAALSHRRRQGDLLGARRGAEGGDPAHAGARPRQARHHALQGPRRDDAEGALGDDAEPEDAAAAAGRRDRPARRPTG